MAETAFDRLWSGVKKTLTALREADEIAKQLAPPDGEETPDETSEPREDDTQ